MEKKKLIAILLIAAITVAIIVPLLLLGGKKPTPPEITILSPTTSTYASQTTNITIDIDVQSSALDTVWYRIYNLTAGAWLDASNVMWTNATNRTLGGGGVFNLYAWVNDTAGQTQVANVLFTMFEVSIITDDTIGDSTFLVNPFQRVFILNAVFDNTPNTVNVLGALAMYNVEWTEQIYFDANSVVNGSQILFHDRVYFTGNVVASLQNVTCQSYVDVWENASVTFTNATLLSQLNTFDNAQFTITNSTIQGTIYAWDNSQVNTLDTPGATVYGYYDSTIMLTNYDSPGFNAYAYHNSTLTLINSSFNNVLSYPFIMDGS